ncbi:MAG: sigma-70 family RNA polymerase sigma factor [Planctomycetota bacterium]
MTDQQALHAYATDGDPEAFASLVRAHQRMVYAVCVRRLGDAAEAEDATQDTFLKLAGQAGRIRGSVAAWLHRSATTTSIDLARRRSTRRRHTRAAASASAASDSPAEVSEARELVERIDEAVASLGRADRELICEHYLAGRTHAELAASLGVSRSLVSRRLRRALGRLRDRLSGSGAALATGALVSTLQTQAAGAAVPAAVEAGLIKIGLSGVGSAQAGGGGAAWSAFTLKAGVHGLAWSTKTKLIAGGVVAALLIGVGVSTLPAVWRGPSTIAQASDELAALGYDLAPGESMRLVPGPYSELRNAVMAERITIGDYENVVAVFTRADNGVLSLDWTLGGGNPELRGLSLAHAALGLPSFRVEGLEALDLPEGDLVRRAGLTDSERREAYAAVLVDHMGVHVSWSPADREFECVIWDGAASGVSDLEVDALGRAVVYVTAGSLDAGRLAGERAMAQTSSLEPYFAELDMPYLVEGGASVRPRVIYMVLEDAQIDRDSSGWRGRLDAVLGNLGTQVGGAFETGLRPFEVWTVHAAR